MKDESAGLLAAAFIGIVPGYISRSVAGSYDNEAIAIFLLMFTFYCWIKALKQGSALFGTMAAVFYFYMVAAWGTFRKFPSLFWFNNLSLHKVVMPSSPIWFHCMHWCWCWWAGSPIAFMSLIHRGMPSGHCPVCKCHLLGSSLLVRANIWARLVWSIFTLHTFGHELTIKYLSKACLGCFKLWRSVNW